MDYDILLRFLVALIFVLGLIGLLAWAARRFGIGGRVAVRSGRRRRMAIVEATAVDAKRRLVLVRRDDVEHLILLGPTVDLVVEQGIAVPADQLEAPPSAGPSAGGQPRDFSSELKALVGFGESTGAATGVPAPSHASAPPKTPLAGARRRLSKSKLAQLKPERLRFGKQPGTKR